MSEQSVFIYLETYTQTHNKTHRPAIKEKENMNLKVWQSCMAVVGE